VARMSLALGRISDNEGGPKNVREIKTFYERKLVERTALIFTASKRRAKTLKGFRGTNELAWGPNPRLRTKRDG